MISTAIVFDADNILWDTDAVFRRAQLGLLQVFVKEGVIRHAEPELMNLRLMDKMLAKLYGKFEYDLTSLPIALYRQYHSRESLIEAAQWTIQHNNSTTDLIKRACEVFTKNLEDTPPLFEDAKELLHSLQAFRLAGYPIITIMFSEGEITRLSRTIEAHNLRRLRLFDEIVLRPKSIECFQNVRRLALRHLPVDTNNPNSLLVMIGDSLKRDVMFANLAGFVTVYKPSNFLGQETPCTREEEPNFQINSLLALPQVLDELGASLQQIGASAPSAGYIASGKSGNVYSKDSKGPQPCPPSSETHKHQI
ncbi:MAG TPA: hypothetical protein VLB46_01920 [Pyrinomonadaceae bacterium]|nr:hypothetical protein [Pyrinomonadaceae bacterium]